MASVGGAATPSGALEGAASFGALLSKGVKAPSGPERIDNSGVIIKIAVVTVPDPLPDVAEHIVEAKIVRLVHSHMFGGVFFSVVGDVLDRSVGWARGACAGGKFPFCFGGQAIPFAVESDEGDVFALISQGAAELILACGVDIAGAVLEEITGLQILSLREQVGEEEGLKPIDLLDRALIASIGKRGGLKGLEDLFPFFLGHRRGLEIKIAGDGDLFLGAFIGIAILL